MADIADQSQQQEEDLLRAAQMMRKQEGPKFTGCCANCGAMVKAPQRWCDTDCLNDWMRRQREK